MRISDWSSDVCSSDLLRLVIGVGDGAGAKAVAQRIGDVIGLHDLGDIVEMLVEEAFPVMGEAPFRHDRPAARDDAGDTLRRHRDIGRSEEHTSELQSLMRISYAVFCLKKKKQSITATYIHA